MGQPDARASHGCCANHLATPMIKFEKPDKKKLLIGIGCCLVSAGICFVSYWGKFITLGGTGPNDPGIVVFIPGLTFGIALIIPTLFDSPGTRSRVNSLVLFPLISFAIWMLCALFTFIILHGPNLGYNLPLIGLFSSLILFGIFNVFFNRRIKFLNYVLVGLLGLLSLLIWWHLLPPKDHELYKGALGMIISIWQILVGIGISLSYKKDANSDANTYNTQQ